MDGPLPQDDDGGMGRFPATSTVAALTLMLTVVLACAGCGSHDSTPSTALPSFGNTRAPATLDARFWRRAGRACRPFRVFDDAHPVVVPGMNPEHPTTAQLAAMSAFDRRTHSPFARHHVWTRIVHRLGEPRTGVAEWRRIASDLHAYDLARDAEYHALRARDVGLWHRAYDRTVGVLDTLAVDLGAAEVPSTNECMRVFG
jgi:hypothetical protein